MTAAQSYPFVNPSQGIFDPLFESTTSGLLGGFNTFDSPAASFGLSLFMSNKPAATQQQQQQPLQLQNPYLFSSLEQEQMNLLQSQLSFSAFHDFHPHPQSSGTPSASLSSSHYSMPSASSSLSSSTSTMPLSSPPSAGSSPPHHQNPTQQQLLQQRQTLLHQISNEMSAQQQPPAAASYYDINSQLNHSTLQNLFDTQILLPACAQNNTVTASSASSSSSLSSSLNPAQNNAYVFPSNHQQENGYTPYPPRKRSFADSEMSSHDDLGSGDNSSMDSIPSRSPSLDSLKRRKPSEDMTMSPNLSSSNLTHLSSTNGNTAVLNNNNNKSNNTNNTNNHFGQENGVAAGQPTNSFLLHLLEQQTQIHHEAFTSEFDSERMLKQSKAMRNKLRGILGKLKKKKTD